MCSECNATFREIRNEYAMTVFLNTLSLFQPKTAFFPSKATDGKPMYYCDAKMLTSYLCAC